ncbi:MAG: ABC transporter ATP-binding protein [Rhodospirillales bacterium]|nr:ABC transporter ATP-binding protein [Rhodospirillales bacterium]
MNEQASGLALSAVTKSFRQGSTELEILKGADLTLSGGEMVALVGPSGAGKSTLLQIAGLLEKPDSGEVTLGDQATGKLRDHRRTKLRRTLLGFVYQYHHLLPEFSALENVAIPQMIAGRRRAEARTRAVDLLTKVGLNGRLDHRPAMLSGGEQQRVAIARALANRPQVLLADEPTGNLDPHTANEIFALLRKMVEKEKVAALIATHNYDLAGRMDRSLRLAEGKVEELASGPIDISDTLIRMSDAAEISKDTDTSLREDKD